MTLTDRADLGCFFFPFPFLILLAFCNIPALSACLVFLEPERVLPLSVSEGGEE